MSDTQIDRILAIHDRPPVMAADGDKPGRDANVEWAIKAIVRGRESVIVDWPDNQDPVSWLTTHGEDGLCAVTRRGCLEAPQSHVRPRHCGAILTAAALEGLCSNADRVAALASVVDEVGKAVNRLGSKGGARYAAAAAEILGPVTVDIAIEAVTGRGEINSLIKHLGNYGAKLPIAGHVRFAQGAALAIERRDLAAAGWAERRIVADITAARSAQRLSRGVEVDNLPACVSSWPNLEWAD